MSLEGECSICKAPSKQKCASCQLVYYCSREHQKQHWKQHKLECCPVRVKTDPILGRCLVATRNLAAGVVVIKEQPLVRGPPQTSPAVCLGCYTLLEESTAKECTKCGWPVCSAECAASADHVPECHYTVLRGEKAHIQQYGVPHPNYQCITVLRCLHQRDANPAAWERLQSLESHCDKRRGSPRWDEDKKMVADFIRTFFKLEKVFNEDEIMKCCGILQINGHEVPLSEPSYIAIYDKVSLAEHDCRSNCAKSFTSTGDVILVAGVDVAAGENLSICYTDPLWGTESRRHHLADSKYFECECRRCADVTEFGTMFSAVNCKSGSCNGLLLPDTFILPIIDHKEREDCLKKDRFWKCNKCEGKVCDTIIQKLLEDVGKELNAMTKETSEACEKFIAHCSQYLPASHYYLTDVGLALAQMLGQERQENLASISDDKLELKTQLCTNIAHILKNLVPAETRARGAVLFELHAAIAETGRRKAVLEGPVTLLNHVQESRGILAESMKLLRHEPDVLHEGKIAKQAALNIKEMDILLAKLSSCLTTPI